MENFDSQRYRDNLAEDLKNTKKSERVEILESEESTIRYKNAREMHQKEIKEYSLTRIDEKISEHESEISRLNRIREALLGSPEDLDESGGAKSMLDVERELESSNVLECILDTPAVDGEIKNVLTAKTLGEFRERFKGLVEDLFAKNDLNNLAFARKLKPDAEKKDHEALRTVISRLLSGDRSISIDSFQHRDIFKGLGLNISDFASKLESLEVKEKLNYDISESFFNPDRVVLNEFVNSLTKDDAVNFSMLLSLVHKLDNEHMVVPDLEGCILKIKPTKSQILEVLSGSTLEEFNEKFSVLIGKLLESSNITIVDFAEELQIEPSAVSSVKRSARNISIGAEHHQKMFIGLGLEIKMFESRQRKLINDQKHGTRNLENFRYTDTDIKPYISLLAENFPNITISDLIRIAHFIDENFEFLEKNQNVFIEIVRNEFPDLEQSRE